MEFWEFRAKMFDLACLNINQVYAWQPGFNRNNLTRWIKKDISSGYGKAIMPFQNIRTNLITPGILPIKFTAHPI